MDKFSKVDRSRIMAKITGKDTAIEISVRRFLFSAGFRYRKNLRTLPGSPDIVLPKYRTVVFVHGCFWHLHANCNRAKLPTTRADFWKRKIEANRNRDNRVETQLTAAGWKVLKVWRCEMSSKSKRDGRLALLVRQIKMAGSKRLPYREKSTI